MWQKKRLEIMQRDNFTCKDCGDTESQLQVHHKAYIYGNNIWEYDNESLITLCESCHSIITDMKRIIKSRIDYQFISGEQLYYIDKILDSLAKLDISDISQVFKFTNHIFENNSKE